MLNLMCFDDILNILPFLLVPLPFIIVVIIVIVTAVSRAKASQRTKQMNDEKLPFELPDGNGRTQHQRDYLNSKRRELSERKIVSNDGSHMHMGEKVEKYDKIVGSLGEVDDEGCEELDGVRLIEHDESYCDDPDHLVAADITDIQRAVVLGEVINVPRFKQMYKRK